MQFDILPPTGNSRGPLSMESLLRSVHRSGVGSPLRLLIHSYQGKVGLRVDVPSELKASFLQELQDSYPGTTVKRVESESVYNGSRMWKSQLRLRPDVLLIRTYGEFIDLADRREFSDPIAGLFAAVSTGRSGRIQCRVEFTIRPARNGRVPNAERIITRLEKGFTNQTLRRWFLFAATSHRSIERLLGNIIGRLTRTTPQSVERLCKTDDQLFTCEISLQVTAPKDALVVANGKLREIAGAFGRYSDGKTSFKLERHRRSLHLNRGFLLTPREVATLWHPLTVSGDTVSRVERPQFWEREPPVCLASKKSIVEETVLGRVSYRQQRNQFGISADDLRRHLLAIGKTGCGKSTFLLNVVRQQVEANKGVVLLDPHGQLADDVLNAIPKRRTNDIIVLDAADSVAPAVFNPMVGPIGIDAHLVADSVLTSFKNVFGFDEGSAPRLLHIFRNCLLSLIDSPHASLWNVQRLLVDANFRKSIVARVENEAIREFWLTEFNRWNERDRTQYIASLQNKLGAFTTNERLQRILNADRKGIQLRDVMDQSKVLICNLSKGRVGHDASTLLGSLLLSSLHVAAMSRADVAEADRPDCTIVVDEFHSYLSEGNSTMADALAESRKYRTSFVLSTQMLEQLDPATLAGVLGNCGSTLCMGRNRRSSGRFGRVWESGNIDLALKGLHGENIGRRW